MTGFKTFAQAKATLPQLIEFLQIPNDANQPEQLEPNIAWLEAAFAERGFTTRRLPTAGIDLLLTEYRRDPSLPTVLVYLQLDGQPVDPSRWYNGKPFGAAAGYPTADGVKWLDPQAELPLDPTLRIYARSASDAKGPIVSFLVGWDQLRAEGQQPPYNLKVIIDTEEELGSPNLPAAVTRFQTELAADHLIIFDGPPHISNRPTLVYGARGIATVRLTVYGPRVPLHSGHYGNYAPNPAMRLAQLLGDSKDDEGRVTIDGWYDGISLDERTKAQLAAVPDDATALNRQLGIAAPDRIGGNLQEAIQYPSLNIRGMASGWVGKMVRTIVPATAVADIDIRLVKESDPERLIGLFRNYVKSKGYHLIENGREPTDAERERYPRLASLASTISYGAFRTPLDGPTGAWLRTALRQTFNEDPVEIRTHGGSIPISPFVKTLKVPAVIIPLVDPSNNQHSPNESLLLYNYFRGAETVYGILRTPLQP
jgi:acetylornithine deacetylase/succinyl-diaminopimelate desuccinylase-like protein